MSIQFPCATCAKPIEVDDEVAGLQAQCPFCQSIIRVPTASTLARPSLHVGAPPPPPFPPKGRVAQRLGVLSLAFSVGAYLLICTGAVGAIRLFPGGLAAVKDGRPTTQQVNAWQAELNQAVWPGASTCSGVGAALIGLVVGIIALTQTRGATNWPGIIGVTLAAVFFGVMCAGFVLMTVQGGLPAA